MELSSKTGHNVELAFYKMALEVHKVNNKPSSREGSGSRKGDSRAASEANSANVMQDRVRLTASTSKKPNEYAAANEMPTAEPKKKKCCA